MNISVLIVIGVIFILGLSGFRIAQEYERALVFRLCRFKGLQVPGLFLIIPLFERSQIVDIRTRTVDLERQETITKSGSLNCRLMDSVENKYL